MKLKEKLIKMNACKEAVEWVGDRDLKTAWAECERAPWMLWFAGQQNVAQKLIVSTACACARTALKYVLEGEDRPRLAIEAAERWAKNPTEKNRVAADAAAHAAHAAHAAVHAADAAVHAADAAVYAAHAAVHAADAAHAAAHAADAAAYAADAAAYAADAAAYAAHAADAAVQKQMADIIRKIITYKDIK